jgi:voltage-gated potassium channel
VSGSGKPTLRRRLAAIFEDEEPRSATTRWFDILLATLIIANVAGIVLESVEPIRRQYAVGLDAFENFATAVFAVEYVARVWASPDLHDARFTHPLWGRLRYMRSFFALVDLAAILPALLGVLGAADLRVLRLVRLLRMLKLVRHSTTFGLLGSVLREEGRSIAALLFVLMLTVTISGSLMFLLEADEQPNVFSSIPAAMWWSIETLTTVGYGDMVPATIVGRLLGGVVSIIGIGTLALFSGLITVGFIDQLKLHRERLSQMPFAANGKPAGKPVSRPVAARLASATSELRADPVHRAVLGPVQGVVHDPVHGADLPVGSLGPARTAAALRVCPHCGVTLPAAMMH